MSEGTDENRQQHDLQTLQRTLARLDDFFGFLMVGFGAVEHVGERLVGRLPMCAERCHLVKPVLQFSINPISRR
jgi:hypothetical protein